MFVRYVVAFKHTVRFVAGNASILRHLSPCSTKIPHRSTVRPCEYSIVRLLAIDTFPEKPVSFLRHFYGATFTAFGLPWPEVRSPILHIELFDANRLLVPLRSAHKFKPAEATSV